MSSRTLFLTNELYEYMISSSVRETDILRQLRKETQQDPMANMQISPEQGQFMSLLVQLIRAKKTLEIGVYTGYSALCVALALPSHGQIIACDINEEWASIAKRYWQKAEVSEKIDFRLTPGIETMDRLLSNGHAQTFDFIFIDADKQEYGSYYKWGIELLRTGGLIAIDNVFWSGKVVHSAFNDKDTQAIRKLNEKLYEDERIELSMIPISDGLTLAMKRY